MTVTVTFTEGVRGPYQEQDLPAPPGPGTPGEGRKELAAFPAKKQKLRRIGPGSRTWAPRQRSLLEFARWTQSYNN